MFETINHLIDARDLGHISLELHDQAREMADEVSRVLNGYVAYLKRSKQGENEPSAKLFIRESVEEYGLQSNGSPSP